MYNIRKKKKKSVATDKQADSFPFIHFLSGKRRIGDGQFTRPSLDKQPFTRTVIPVVNLHQFNP